jgi:hypothetical protein
MDPMQVVEAWDTSLRAGDWIAARQALSDGAQYYGTDGDLTCRTPDDIVELMRSFKGTVPDVQVVEWEEIGDHVLAQLRQPAWGDEADWYQVLTVAEDHIVSLADFETREAAQAALG